MRTSRRSGVIATALAAALVAGITPAFAEGSWSSYIEGWLKGKSSRSWQDNNIDSVSTSVKFAGCQPYTGITFKYADLNLRLEKNWAPDPSKGVKRNTCNTVYWGDVEKGSYHFTVDDQNQFRITIDEVVTRY